MNKFRIYAKKGIYYLILKLENYNGQILSDFNNTKIEVSECRKDQIVMFYYKNIIYCETPLCKLDCPVAKSATCQPGKNIIGVNDRVLNKCKCLPGWKGDNCLEKIYINYR